MVPILLHYPPWLILYSYPLFLGLSWGLAYKLCVYALCRNGISTKGFNGLFIGNFLFSWIGAKLLYLYSSSGSEFLAYAGSTSFWLGGGFVFFGGLILGLLFSFSYTFIFKKFEIKHATLFLAPLSFAHGIGRMGCFFAGCCFGIESDFFMTTHMHGANRIPVQLLETVGLFTLGFLLLRVQKSKGPLFVTIFYLAGYSFLRFNLEFLRGDKIRGIYFGSLSTSQLVSIALFIASMIFISGYKKYWFKQTHH